MQPQVGGRIAEIHFEDGADLKKGDPLFTIDPEPYRAAAASAEANLARAKAVLDLARADLARFANLVATQIASQADYDAKKSAVDVAEADVRQNEAALATARINLQYCSISSPIDGRAGHRLVDRGNVVAANGSPLLVIERLDPIYVDFTVTENDLSAVQRQMAGKSLDVEVRLPDEPIGAPRRQGHLPRQRGAGGDRHGDAPRDRPEPAAPSLAGALRESDAGSRHAAGTRSSSPPAPRRCRRRARSSTS